MDVSGLNYCTPESVRDVACVYELHNSIFYVYTVAQDIIFGVQVYTRLSIMYIVYALLPSSLPNTHTHTHITWMKIKYSSGIVLEKKSEVYFRKSAMKLINTHFLCLKNSESLWRSFCARKANWSIYLFLFNRKLTKYSEGEQFYSDFGGWYIQFIIT